MKMNGLIIGINALALALNAVTLTLIFKIRKAEAE